MEIMTAYCGLACDSCTIYIATLEKDKFQQHELRESILEKCNTIYGLNLKIEDITDCDGCRAGIGRLFPGCLNCEIRKCAESKNIYSCAFCNDFACDVLLKHFMLDPGAQMRLEEIRQSQRI